MQKVLMPIGDATEVMDTLYPSFRLPEDGIEVVVAGLFLSGGRAPEYLRYDQDLLRITRHFFETNKPVAVICHGVEIVAAAGVLKGRTMTTIAKCALDVTQVGGTYVDKPCVVDGNLISARGWQDYRSEFLKHFLRLLKEAGTPARAL